MGPLREATVNSAAVGADHRNMTAPRATWLCPNDEDRARVIENSGRIARARRISSIVLVLMVAYLAPAYNWWIAVLLALSALSLETLDMRMRRSATPEYHASTNVLFTQAIIAVGVAITGGPRSPALALIAVPTVFAATRFRAEVVWLAVATAIAMLLLATLAVDPRATLNEPALLLAAITVTICVTAVAQALSGAELQYRVSAVLDPLTGLLNRQGLEQRFDELSEQARITGASICVLLCDLDHFKEVNDTHGHAIGDVVLRDVAYELRKQLRSFELIYRIGGEEFMVVLPGASMSEAIALGERMCEATRECRTQGLFLTLSIGVSIASGSAAQLHPLYEAADAALYEAKAEGRDRVSSAHRKRPARTPRLAPGLVPGPAAQTSSA